MEGTYAFTIMNTAMATANRRREAIIRKTRPDAVHSRRPKKIWAACGTKF
jgi:hypothetical protein